MIVAADLSAMLNEAMATTDFHTQLEVWGIDPASMGSLLEQYSTEAGKFHAEEGSDPALIVLTSMVAGFEIGYRCRLKAEREEPEFTLNIPDVIPDAPPV